MSEELRGRPREDGGHKSFNWSVDTDIWKDLRKLKKKGLNPSE
ncbi:MAG: hypothetical protein ACREBS_10375 [Nitrososphaerales archaeon]